MVDRRREVLGGARRRAQDDHVGAAVDAHEDVLAPTPEPFDRGGLQHGGVRRAVAALPRHGVDEHAVGVAHLDRAELVEVAGQRRLGDLDAVGARGARRARPASGPRTRSRVSTMRWWRAALVGRTVMTPPPAARRVEDRGQRGHERVGLVRGQDERRGEPHRVGAYGVDEEAGVPRRGLDAAPRPARPARAPATGRRPGGRPAAGGRRASKPVAQRSPTSLTWVSRSSASMVSRTARAAAHDTGLPPKVEPWSPGAKSEPAGPSADAGADGEAAAETLGQRDDVGTHALRRRGEPGTGATDRRSAPRRRRAARPTRSQAARAAAR